MKGMLAPTVGMNLFMLQVPDKTYETILEEVKRNSLSPTLGFMASFYFSRINNRFSIDIGFELNKNYNYHSVRLNTVNTQAWQYWHKRTILLHPLIGAKYTFPKRLLRPTIGFGATLSYPLHNQSTEIKEVEHLGLVTTAETTNRAVSQHLYGGYIQIGCDFTIVKKLDLFANLRAIRTKNYMEQTTSVGLSIGVYL